MNKKKLVIVMTLSLMVGLFGVALARDLVSTNVTVVDEYTIKGDKHFHTGYEPGDAEGNVNVVIEIPKGTTGKWEVSVKEGTIEWEKKNGKPREVKYQGGYIANYGSVPQTALPKALGGDGDPIDIVVLGAPIPRGEVVKVKLVGVLNLMEDGEFDGKLLAVKQGSPEYELSSAEEINAKHEHVIDRISSWFENYKGPDSGLKVEGIGSSEEAMEMLIASIEAYRK